MLFLFKIGSYVNHNKCSKFKREENNQVLRLSLIGKPNFVAFYYVRKLSLSEQHTQTFQSD